MEAVLAVVTVLCGLEGAAIFLLLKAGINNKKGLDRTISELKIQMLKGEKQFSKQIESLQGRVAEESEKKAEYYKRVIELENGIKAGAGVNLRKEVVKYEGIFDDNELFQMKHGLHGIIKERSNHLADVKYLVSIIDKINEHISNIEKSKAGPVDV